MNEERKDWLERDKRYGENRVVGTIEQGSRGRGLVGSPSAYGFRETTGQINWIYERIMRIIRAIGRAVLSKLGLQDLFEIRFQEGNMPSPAKLRFLCWYLKLARILATRGIAPPLSLNSVEMAARWRENPPSALCHYVALDPRVDCFFSDVISLLDKESPILEIGCNRGRALQWLRNYGYTHLTGIEIGKEALELMETTFPGLRQYARIIEGNAPEVIHSFPDKSYDLVFTRSVLVNIGVRYNDIFREMCRVSRRFILIMENENSYMAYPRDFQSLFERWGFKEIMSRTIRPDATLPVPFTDKDIFKTAVLRLFVIDQSCLSA